jgi:hypothetical protein
LCALLRLNRSNRVGLVQLPAGGAIWQTANVVVEIAQEALRQLPVRIVQADNPAIPKEA